MRGNSKVAKRRHAEWVLLCSMLLAGMPGCSADSGGLDKDRAGQTGQQQDDADGDGVPDDSDVCPDGTFSRGALGPGCGGGCSLGFAANAEQTRCRDVDECADGTDDCVAQQTCMNTEGSFECACPKDHLFDGDRCIFDNRCMLLSCHEHARCEANSDSRRCVCNPGFEGDGRTCIDQVDGCAEASEGHARCQVALGGVCRDQEGDYRCESCPSFYARELSGRDCEDINECLTDNGGCHAEAYCLNQRGAEPICGCYDGLVGDGLHCTVDPCESPDMVCSPMTANEVVISYACIPLLPDYALYDCAGLFPNHRVSAPDVHDPERFSDLQGEPLAELSEVVWDNLSGLQWQRAPHGFGANVALEEATRYCDALTLEGKDDFRLPTVMELNGLINDRASPAVFAGAFPRTPSGGFDMFITSSISAQSEYERPAFWRVRFTWGSQFADTTGNWVRCVRGGGA